MFKVGLEVEGRSVVITVPEDVAVEVVRQPEQVTLSEFLGHKGNDAGWEACIAASEHAALERTLCRRAQERGWVVEHSQSVGPHRNDINIYPPHGNPRIRLAAFYAPTGRVAFHNRVREGDAGGRAGIDAVYDNHGKSNQRFAGLRIRLRTEADVDTALDLASLVFERIATK